MRLRTRQAVKIDVIGFTSIIETETDANVTHGQKSTFKHNRVMAAMNKADYLQGERIDIKDERKETQRKEREQKRRQYKY
jgi:hypothetical protein